MMTPKQVERIKRAIYFHTEARQNLLEWSEKNRYLPPSSPAPGRYSSRNAPYQAEILRMITESQYSHFFLCFGAQTGKTEILLNAIAYYIAYDPSTILVVLPTEGTARDFVKTRIDPLLKTTPVLAEKFKFVYNNPENTATFKLFDGGWLAIAWAGSEAQLASRPVRILLLDEIDRFPILGEGDAYSIAEKRTQAYWNRRVIVSSTPTDEETSRIWALKDIADQYEYQVQCPKCSEFFAIKWEHVIWQEDDPSTARVRCPYCGYLISERERRIAVQNGKWVLTQEGERKDHAWFHLPALNSLFLTLESIVQDFMNSKDSPERLKVFVNTVLAEPWRMDYTEESVENELLNLTFVELPQNLTYTAGVDIQEDRIACTIAGMDQEGNIYVVDHQVFYGHIIEDLVWEKLFEYLEEKNPQIIFLDSSAYTERVYQKVAEYRKVRKNMFAIKGFAGAVPVINKVTYLNHPHIPLVSVGVDSVKEILYMRLTSKQKILFTPTLREDYFLELTAERPIIRYQKGQAKRMWKKIRDRNEAWDCLVYALAAQNLVRGNEARPVVVQRQSIQRKKKTSWLKW